MTKATKTMVELYEKELLMKIRNRHYSEDVKTAAYEFYGFVTALVKIGFLEEGEIYVDLNYFLEKREVAK